MAKQIIETLFRLGVGGLFVFAGVVKIWDFKGGGSATQEFALEIQNYQMTTWTVAILAAIYLPWLEVFAGLALISRRLYAGGLALLLGLVAFFLIALSSAWARGLDISCGCFGRSDVAVNYPEKIGQDVLLLAVLALLLWWEWRRARLSAARVD